MLTEKAPQSVLIVSGSEKGQELFSDILPKSLFDPVTVASSAGEARRQMISGQFDIVIVNSPLPDEFGTELAVETAESSPAGVMIIVRGEMFDQVSYKVEDYGVFTLAKPSSKSSIYQAIKLLVATRMRMRGVEKKNATLQAKMNEIRLVNRAKWLLIERLNMSESTAHRYIEKQAMDMRTTRMAVAESILNTYES